jgi:hypothetical protein
MEAMALRYAPTAPSLDARHKLLSGSHFQSKPCVSSGSGHSLGSPLLSPGVPQRQRRPRSGLKQSHRRQRALRQGSWLDRGCESHPPSWVVHGGTRPQQRRREAGLDAEEDEQTGRNESEPHIMSLDISQTGDKPSPSSLGEGRWERVGQQPASAQRSGGVCVDSTSGRQARVTWEDSGDGK